MFWKWLIRLLQKFADWSDTPTRWWRRTDLRFAKPLGALGGRSKLASRFNKFYFRSLRLLSKALDWPVRWFRRVRPAVRKQPKKLSWFARVEGAVNKGLLALLWFVRIPLDRGERLFGRKKKLKQADPKLVEQQLKLALQRKNAEKAHRAQLAKSWPGRLGRYVIIPAFGIWVFLRAYAKTRTMAVVWWGVPVAITLGLLVSVYFQFSFLDYSQVAVRYESALAVAVKAGDTVQADRFRLKLEQLGVCSDRSDYQSALAMSNAGNLPSAYAMMLQIAPPTRPGFPGAHFWIIEKLLDGKLEMPTQQAAELALQHLAQIRIRVGEADELWFLEGLAYFRLGDYSLAQQSLERVKAELPPANALLLEIHQQQGNTKLAREIAVTLHRQIQQLVQEGKELSPDELRWRAAASQVIGDETLAVAAVEEWYRANPTSRAAKLNRATLQLQPVDIWLRNPVAQTITDIASRIKAADAMLPSDDLDLIFDRLNLIAANSQGNEAVQQLFGQLLSDENFTPPVIAHLGSLAAAKGQWVDAERLLARATQLDPQLANAWNNLAFVLNIAYPSRRFAALELADTAIKLDPDRVDFRQTRGTILFNLRRWDQAIPDLEIASNGSKDLEFIHQMLAESYRQVGNPVLAETYRAVSDPQ